MKLVVFGGLTREEDTQILESILSASDCATWQRGSTNELSSLIAIASTDKLEEKSTIGFIYDGGLDELEVSTSDIELHTVCFYSPPETALDETLELAESLSIWREQASSILNHYFSDPNACSLVNASVLTKNCLDFYNWLAQEHNINVHEPLQNLPRRELSDVVKTAFNMQCLAQEFAVQNLFEQLEGAAELFGGPLASGVLQRQVSYLTDIKFLSDEALTLNEELITQQAGLESNNLELEHERSELEAKLAEIETKHHSVSAQLEGLLEREEEYQKRLAIKREKLAILTKELETTSSQHESESELALLQIQQLQEELEATFNDKHSLQTDKASLEVSLESLESQLIKANDSQQQLQNELKEAHHKNEQLTQQHVELTSESELSLLQIHQLQEELEFYYIKYQQGGLWTPIDSPSTEVIELENTLSLLAK